MSTLAVTDVPHSLLLVDDEPRVIDAIRRRVAQIEPHLVVHSAVRGSEALKILQAEPIDLIISDLRMPGVDGAAVLQAARRARPDALRIVLSGQASTELLLAAMPSSHRYIEKPCSTEQLRSVFSLMSLLSASQLPQTLVKHLLTLSSLPVDGLFVEVLKRSLHPALRNYDALPVSADLGLYLSALRMGVIVHGESFTATSLPVNLLQPLLSSPLLVPLYSTEEVLNGLRLLAIRSKLVEHKLAKVLPDPRYATAVAARLYLGQYVLMSTLGVAPEFMPFIETHGDEVGQLMSELWGLPKVLSGLTTLSQVRAVREEVDNFLSLSELEQFSATDLLSILSEVLCSAPGGKS